MRRGVLLSFLALCLVVAGCGGGQPKSVSALDDALGYFAKDAPFVAAVQTDPNNPQIKQFGSLGGGFAGVLAARLANISRLHFVSFDQDVRPQLGAPLVIGLARPAAGSGLGTVTLVAIHVKHPLRVKQVLLRQPNVRGRGKTSGVRIYEDPIDSRYYAVDGDTLVAGANRDILAAALALRRSDNRMRASGFNRDLEHLPGNGVVRISADPKSLIGVDPRLRPALGVKWIASMRRLGAVLTAAPTGVRLDFHLATDPAGLGQANLPLAPKQAVLPLIGKSNEVQIAISEPARLARLAFAVWRAIAPHQAAAVRQREPRGVDLEQQIPRHLGKVAQIAVDPTTRAFAARVDLNDAAEVKTALGVLAPVLPDLAAQLGVQGVGVASPTAGESFYALAKPSTKTAVFGVLGRSLVAASEAQRAASLPSERTHPAPHAVRGAAVFTLDARMLATRILANRLGGAAALIAPALVGPLRDLTGVLTISRSGLDGHVRLAIVK